MDWSSYILIQPASDAYSHAVIKNLFKKTGICNFNLTINGLRLQLISFGPCVCTTMKQKLKSLLGKEASGLWSIGKNRKYLWRSYFYWICDCKSVKETLDYSGTIAVIAQWAQKMLGYYFSIIHCNHKMMKDVDVLSRNYVLSFNLHIVLLTSYVTMILNINRTSIAPRFSKVTRVHIMSSSPHHPHLMTLLLPLSLPHTTMPVLILNHTFQHFVYCTSLHCSYSNRPTNATTLSINIINIIILFHVKYVGLF